ncbi:uncharacterized protein ACNLHF_003377 isoform 2-T2 [Anomaloglossus baeobatrachus]|uniref:uncharacterized protein LOC142258456 isoform X2 n=1 Tax=Anomaloglossus baeobatrachus TaxID=238106 RepID=UPI003F4F998E
MKVALFLLLSASLLDVVLATRHKERHAISQSTIHLTTSFDQTPTEVIWKHKTPENAMQIAKMQNGLMIDRLNSRYTLGPNGSDLCIHDVTERDNGFYIAEATLADNRIENEKFYLMVHVKVKTRTRVPIVLFLIIIIITAAVCGVIYWTCSNRSKQGDPENQNLKTSVQDSESTFNNISHGKTNVKMKEEDVELECFEVKS